MKLHYSIVSLAIFGFYLAAAPVPKAIPEGRIMVGTVDGKLRLIEPDGKELKSLTVEDAGMNSMARLSPDGERIAYTYLPKKENSKVQIYSIGWDGKTRVDYPEAQQIYTMFWSRDGKSIYASGFDQEAANLQKKPFLQCNLNWQIDTKNGKATTLPIEGDCLLSGLSADGKQLFAWRRYEPKLVNDVQVAGKFETVFIEPEKFTSSSVISDEIEAIPVTQFPDGKRWLIYRIDGKSGRQLAIFDPAKKEVEKLANPPEGYITAVALSPDGKRVIYATAQSEKLEGEETWALRVADSDGKNPKVIVKSKSPIRSLDWK